MLEIDGAAGGGQLLRTALSLALCTGEAFTMRNIRAGRTRPGLMRQHLTAVQAACEISGSEAIGAAPESQTLEFRPGKVRAGRYHFAIGTAGSTTLVLQTLLAPLAMADAPSQLSIEGGTHNSMAPPVDFLQQSWLPLLQRMGIQAEVTLRRVGFYPAGGGKIAATIHPGRWLPLRLDRRGELQSVRAQVLISAVAEHIGERELAVVRQHFPSPELQATVETPQGSRGPGNVLSLALDFDAVTEVFSGFGERRVAAEAVAEQCCGEALEHLRSSASISPRLADQLLLPMALAGGGRFSTSRLSNHLRSNAKVIEKFLPVRVETRENDGVIDVEIR